MNAFEVAALALVTGFVPLLAHPRTLGEAFHIGELGGDEGPVDHRSVTGHDAILLVDEAE